MSAITLLHLSDIHFRKNKKPLGTGRLSFFGSTSIVPVFIEVGVWEIEENIT